MIEIIRILGREYPIECKGKTEALEAKRLALSLEKRLTQFLGQDALYRSHHTHGMILVGLQLERELEISAERELSGSLSQGKEQDLQARIADLQQERDVLRANNEKLIEREQGRLQNIQKLEEKIDSMLEKFSKDSTKR